MPMASRMLSFAFSMTGAGTLARSRRWVKSASRPGDAGRCLHGGVRGALGTHGHGPRGWIRRTPVRLGRARNFTPKCPDIIVRRPSFRAVPEHPGRCRMKPLEGIRVIDIATYIAAPALRHADGRVRRRGHQGRAARQRRANAQVRLADGVRRDARVAFREPQQEVHHAGSAQARGRRAVQTPGRRGRRRHREFPARHARALGDRLGRSCTRSTRGS